MHCLVVSLVTYCLGLISEYVCQMDRGLAFFHYAEVSSMPASENNIFTLLALLSVPSLIYVGITSS